MRSTRFCRNMKRLHILNSLGWRRTLWQNTFTVWNKDRLLSSVSKRKNMNRESQVKNLWNNRLRIQVKLRTNPQEIKMIIIAKTIPCSQLKVYSCTTPINSSLLRGKLTLRLISQLISSILLVISTMVPSKIKCKSNSSSRTETKEATTIIILIRCKANNSMGRRNRQLRKLCNKIMIIVIWLKIRRFNRAVVVEMNARYFE